MVIEAALAANCLRLLSEDMQLSELEVRRAGLAEAFVEINSQATREAA